MIRKILLSLLILSGAVLQAQVYSSIDQAIAAEDNSSITSYTLELSGSSTFTELAKKINGTPKRLGKLKRLIWDDKENTGVSFRDFFRVYSVTAYDLDLDYFEIINYKQSAFKIVDIRGKNLDSLVIKNSTLLNTIKLTESGFNDQFKDYTLTYLHLEGLTRLDGGFPFEEESAAGKNDNFLYKSLKHYAVVKCGISSDLPEGLLKLPNLESIDISDNDLYSFHLTDIDKAISLSKIKKFDARRQKNVHTEKFIEDPANFTGAEPLDTLPAHTEIVEVLGGDAASLFELRDDTLSPQSFVTVLYPKAGIQSDDIYTNIIKFKTRYQDTVYSLLYPEEKNTADPSTRDTDFENSRKPSQVYKIDLKLPSYIVGKLYQGTKINIVELDSLNNSTAPNPSKIVFHQFNKAPIEDTTHFGGVPIYRIVEGAQTIIEGFSDSPNLTVTIRPGKTGRLGVQAYYRKDSSYTFSDTVYITIRDRVPIDSLLVLNSYMHTRYTPQDTAPNGLINVQADTTEPLFMNENKKEDTVQVLENAFVDFFVLPFPLDDYTTVYDTPVDSLEVGIESTNRAVVEPTSFYSDNSLSRFKITDPLGFITKFRVDTTGLQKSIDKGGKSRAVLLQERIRKHILPLRLRTHSPSSEVVTITMRDKFKKEDDKKSILATTKFKVNGEKKVLFGPNPIPKNDKKVNFYFQSTEPRSFIIYDSYGRFVARRDQRIYRTYGQIEGKTTYETTVHLKDFPSGTYFIRLERTNTDTGFLKTIILE